MLKDENTNNVPIIIIHRYVSAIILAQNTPINEKLGTTILVLVVSQNSYLETAKTQTTGNMHEALGAIFSDYCPSVTNIWFNWNSLAAIWNYNSNLINVESDCFPLMNSVTGPAGQAGHSWKTCAQHLVAQ